MQDLIQEAIDLLANLDAVDSARFTNVIDSINAMAGALANAAAKAREAASALPAGAPPEGVNYGPQNGRGSVKPASKLAPKTSPLPRLPSVDASFGLPDPAKGGGGGGGRSQSDYEREAQSIKEEIAQLELESAALVAAAMAGQRYAGAIEQARREAELLAAAQRDGRELTPALRAEVSAMAAGYQLAADAASQAADRIQAVQDAQAELRDTAKSAFVGLINGTLSWKDALAQVLAQLAEMAASRAFEMFFTGTPSTGGGSSGSSATGDIFAMILGAVLGFDKGGYTGAGPRLEPAGIVHKGEYVLSKRAVDRLGVPGLEALHQSALKGYAGGGLVTGGNTPTVPGMSASKAAAGPSITISSPITVNATGSTPEANTDLANKIARAHRDQMKALVHGELRAALRPGGSLNRG